MINTQTMYIYIYIYIDCDYTFLYLFFFKKIYIYKIYNKINRDAAFIYIIYQCIPLITFHSIFFKFLKIMNII